MHRRHMAMAGCVPMLAILAACAAAPLARPPVVPESLAVPPDQALSRVLQASGVQIYECRSASADPSRLQWAFKAPEAQLRDRSGRIVGRHYGGPTWEAHDGSKVVGEVRSRYDAPDPDAIPWLLLSATSTTGHGLFSQTLSIQRLHTSGGKAPASACDKAHEGQEARVPYQAEYLFYALRR